MRTRMLSLATLLTFGPWMPVNAASGNNITIPNRLHVQTSAGGSTEGLAYEYAIENLIPGRPRTTVVQCVYLPEKGLGWAGTYVGTNLVAMGQSLVGFYLVPRSAILHVFCSTNQYPMHLEDHREVLKQELCLFTNNAHRFLYRAPIQVHLSALLGKGAFEKGFEAVGPAGTFTMYSPVSAPTASIIGIDGNDDVAIVSVQGVDGMIVRVAFDEFLRPKWATTNGVPVGSLHTNSVWRSGLENGRLVRTLIY